MFASKCSEAVLTITKPRFCILSGQDVFPPAIGHLHDQYGKTFAQKLVLDRLFNQRSSFPDEVKVFYELGINKTTEELQHACYGTLKS
jgi:hypothetical protein